MTTESATSLHDFEHIRAPSVGGLLTHTRAAMCGRSGAVTAVPGAGPSIDAFQLDGAAIRRIGGAGPVPIDSRYGAWVAGSFHRRLEVLVDGKRVRVERHQLSDPGVYAPATRSLFGPERTG
jgi:hypothetical protein